MIRAWQDGAAGQWFSTLARDGHIVANAGPFPTEEKARAFFDFEPAPNRHGYNAAAVDKAIASSNRHGRKIGTREAKAIHALLKGR